MRGGMRQGLVQNKGRAGGEGNNFPVVYKKLLWNFSFIAQEIFLKREDV